MNDIKCEDCGRFGEEIVDLRGFNRVGTWWTCTWPLPFNMEKRAVPSEMLHKCKLFKDKNPEKHNETIKQVMKNLIVEVVEEQFRNVEKDLPLMTHTHGTRYKELKRRLVKYLPEVLNT